MQAQPSERPAESPSSPIDWEAFYRDYRKPDYIAGYEIVTKLGGGMFGMVFKARKASIGKDYAIKFLKVDDESVREAVRREFKSVRFFAQIDHPNLVSIEDRGEVDGIPYIVMSYAGEETLQKRLENGLLPRDEALRLFIQAARGVQALHEHSLVHFDLKPANVFLRGDIARVGDYGLSKLVTQSRNSLSFGRGTPYYMAPEVLQRRGDARSDIYSLGVILYECLCGEVPFQGDSEWEVLRKHESEPVRFPTHVGQAERRVIERALAKRPEDRFASVSELLHALQAPATLGESLILPSRDPNARFERTPFAGAATPSAGPDSQGAPLRGATVDGSDVEGASVAAAPARRAHPIGPIAGIMRLVFRLFEFAIFLALLPIRLVAMVLGRLLVVLIQLPFRIIGYTAKVIGMLLVFLVAIAAAAVLLSLLTPISPW